MAWAYLIVFDEDLGSREEIQNFLNSVQEITYWYSCMSNVVFFTSTLSAKTIADKALDHFGKGLGKRFLVTEVHTDRQGWLPNESDPISLDTELA